jgi:16S rRNA (adenine1518-N6/adenine1519-N6)-dimethyltransferase
VKTAFRQRRKMLRNSLKSLIKEGTELDPKLLTERPEQLSVKEFIHITNKIDQYES